jgi:hypothetical protein
MIETIKAARQDSGFFTDTRQSVSRPEVFGQATLATVSNDEPRRSRALR